MFTTDAAIKTEVAAALKVASSSDLQAWWDTVIARAHLAAYQEIVGQLIRRGFSKAVIDTWDRGTEFEKDLSLYYCFTSPQGAGAFDLKAVQLWDRRKELETVIVFVSGSPVKPTDPNSAAEVVGFGNRVETGGIFDFPEFTDGSQDDGDGTQW